MLSYHLPSVRFDKGTVSSSFSIPVNNIHPTDAGKRGRGSFPFSLPPPLLRVAHPRLARSDASSVGDAGWRWLLEKEVAAVSPSPLFHRPLLRVTHPRPARSGASSVGDAGWRWLRRGPWFFHMYIRVAVDLVRLGFMPWCGLMPVGIPAARPCEQSLVVAVIHTYI
uniref:Uncharacterized protein n=1 Tax=Aegilops tauschii subsp. strangulata TaxID=200361 RepID=A0A453ESL0_AEGTS